MLTCRRTRGNTHSLRCLQHACIAQQACNCKLYNRCKATCLAQPHAYAQPPAQRYNADMAIIQGKMNDAVRVQARHQGLLMLLLQLPQHCCPQHVQVPPTMRLQQLLPHNSQGRAHVLFLLHISSSCIANTSGWSMLKAVELQLSCCQS